MATCKVCAGPACLDMRCDRCQCHLCDGPGCVDEWITCSICSTCAACYTGRREPRVPEEDASATVICPGWCGKGQCYACFDDEDVINKFSICQQCNKAVCFDVTCGGRGEKALWGSRCVSCGSSRCGSCNEPFTCLQCETCWACCERSDGGKGVLQCAFCQKGICASRQACLQRSRRSEGVSPQVSRTAKHALKVLPAGTAQSAQSSFVRHANRYYRASHVCLAMAHSARLAQIHKSARGVGVPPAQRN